MKYIQGDPIFRRNGTPGIVREVDKSKAHVKVDSDGGEVKRHFRHGYLQGLSNDNRKRFNEIMDQVNEVESPLEKVHALRNHVNQLELDADLKSREVIGYLKSEIAHVMFTKSISPRYYTLEANKVP